MAKRISSSMTVYHKLFFPTLWLCLFGFGTATMFVQDGPTKWMFFILLIFGSLLISGFCLPLKYVSIEGSDLLISGFQQTIRVPASNILDITENFVLNTHPVWIHFRTPTEFGSKIMFMPKTRMFALFSSHPVVAELKQLAWKNGDRKSPPPWPRPPSG